VRSCAVRRRRHQSLSHQNGDDFGGIVFLTLLLYPCFRHLSSAHGEAPQRLQPASHGSVSAAARSCRASISATRGPGGVLYPSARLQHADKKTILEYDVFT